MAHDDWRAVQLPNDRVIVVDDLGDAEPGDLVGVLAEVLDAALHAGPRGSDDLVALLAIAIDPVLPAQRGEPEAVDQNNRVGGRRIGSRCHYTPPKQRSMLLGSGRTEHKLVEQWSQVSNALCQPYGTMCNVTSIERRSRPVLLALIGVSLAGTADVAEFLVSRTTMFADAPGRAAGSVVGLALWVALWRAPLGAAPLRYLRGERRGSRAVTLGLAGIVAAGSVGLTAIHMKAGGGGVRPTLSGILGVLALILAIASRDP